MIPPSPNCSGPCGPAPGPECVDYFQHKCNDATYGAVDLGVLRRGSPKLSIASLLMLRKERGWFVTGWWKGTSSTRTVPLLEPWWIELNRNVGTPTQQQW